MRKAARGRPSAHDARAIQEKSIQTISLFLLAACLSSPGWASARQLDEHGPTPVEASSLERPPLAAPGSLGFWLVGIVVADDPAISLAIIKFEKESEQKVYREGDRANDVLIKRILRNEVIVDAGKGDRRLSVQLRLATRDSRVPQDLEPPQRAMQEPAGDRPISDRHRIIRLDRNEVASALANVKHVLEQVRLSPVTPVGRSTGFRITNIPSGGIISKLGLHNGDVIKRVDDERITDLEQVTEFLRRAKQGGQLKITVNKRRRTRHVVLQIQ